MTAAAFDPVALDPATLGLLVAAGLAAGVVNTLAGGGSLITLPALLFVGLPAPMANGTNRVGVLVQSATAAWRFHARGAMPTRAALALLPATGLGAGLGAWASLQLGEVGLRRAIAVVMVVVLITVWVRPQRWLEARGGALPAWAGHAVFFGIGLYGGFIQAGVGVVLLAGLVAARGLPLVRANAAKVLLVLLFTLPALGVFWWSGQVDWLAGLALSAGSAVGAELLGARLALKRGGPLIRLALTVVVVASVLKLLVA